MGSNLGWVFEEIPEEQMQLQFPWFGLSWVGVAARMVSWAEAKPDRGRSNGQSSSSGQNGGNGHQSCRSTALAGPGMPIILGLGGESLDLEYMGQRLFGRMRGMSPTECG